MDRSTAVRIFLAAIVVSSGWTPAQAGKTEIDRHVEQYRQHVTARRNQANEVVLAATDAVNDWDS